MSDPVVLLHNPAAGSGRASAEVTAQFRRAFGDAARILTTTPPGGDATALHAALRALVPRTLLCIAGGDGTLHFAVNALDRALRDAPWPRLAHLATGSANDGARSLALLTGRAHDRGQIEDELRTIAQSVAHGRAGHAADLGSITTASGQRRLFANFAAVGSPADWARLSARAWVAGVKRVSVRAAYEICNLVVIARRRTCELQIGREDGPPAPRRLFAWFAANARFLGGGIDLGPSVRLNSGVLHVLAIDAAPRLALVRLLTATKRGHGPQPDAAHHIRLHLPPRSHVNLDGEVMALGDDRVIDVQVVRDRVRWL